MQSNSSAVQNMPLHFVESSTQLRAELVRIGTALGHHCELYADYSELAAHPPRTGIIFVRDSAETGGVRFALERMIKLGISLPVVAMDVQPSSGRVVQAIKDGALDYLVLPLRPERLSACLARISREAVEVNKTRERAIMAMRRLDTLSAREREVLDALAIGGSNKAIARQLQISPRTVEIHRANMMSKLGARHAAEAVRIKLESKFGQILEAF